ncbi:YdcF family protein [Nocardia fusca]|uniref:YdcF family protein n=1 Tax=Nocardia fusca TaxID=941183 RepID=UPI0018DDD4EB|nr:YdcF family protein [Nocardia fusca]
MTTGISDAVGKERGLISNTRASAGMFVRAERGAAIPIDTSARALIGNDQVYGGRREDAYTAWFRELHDRGVDTDRAMSDLGKLWDYLRRDPKWEIDPARNYGGIIFFGSKDIGGASVIANLVRDRGLGDVPVVFSGSNGEAAKFRLAAEKMKLDPRQIIEEPKAANTGQNAAFSVQMLADHGRDISSLIGVCTPFHTRRVWATVMQQGIADVNGKRVSVDHVAMSTAHVSLENYMQYGNRPDADTARSPAHAAMSGADCPLPRETARRTRRRRRPIRSRETPPGSHRTAPAAPRFRDRSVPVRDRQRTGPAPTRRRHTNTAGCPRAVRRLRRESMPATGVRIPRRTTGGQPSREDSFTSPRHAGSPRRLPFSERALPASQFSRP